MSEYGQNLRPSTARSASAGESGEVSAPLARGASSRREPINILIVDDEPKNLTVLQSILDEPDYRLVRAESADQALLALIADQYALLILDVRMPGMNGFELAQIIKERKKTAQVPIIFLTAYYSEDQHVLEGYGAGAVDYLHKPVNASILRSKVAVFAELYRKNREAVWSSNALMAEVSERRRADEQLRELNETLENRVAARTAELLESRARLRHAADLARLTYFDFDYARGRMETADNFSRIMGFALPHVSDAADAIAALRTEAKPLIAAHEFSDDLLELRNMIEVADLIVRCARKRHESRGLHYTTDYPDTLDAERHDTVLSRAR